MLSDNWSLLGFHCFNHILSFPPCWLFVLHRDNCTGPARNESKQGSAWRSSSRGRRKGAAVLLQKLQRGRLARRNYDKERRVVEMKKQKEEFVKRIEWAEEIKRKQAAIKIQRMRRSQMARRSVLEEIRRLKQEKLERKRQLAMDKAKERIAIEQRIKEMAERRKAKAVTSIAKVWRGYKVRVETARIKQARATASRLREQQRLEAKALRKREERIEQRRRADSERRRQEDLAKKSQEIWKGNGKTRPPERFKQHDGVSSRGVSNCVLENLRRRGRWPNETKGSGSASRPSSSAEGSKSKAIHARARDPSQQVGGFRGKETSTNHGEDPGRCARIHDPTQREERA